MQAMMPTTKPKVTVVLDEALMKEVKQLAEDEYRSLSQMSSVLIREAVEARRDRKSRNGGKTNEG